MRHIRERIEKELRELERELRIEVPKEIEKALALGDLRENAEYHAALDRQRYLQARIAQVQERLSQLSSVRMDNIPTDRVGFGSLVTVLDLDTGEELRYELVIADESNPSEGKISVSSPIGRALLDHRVGDEVTVKTPKGERALELTGLVTIHDREAPGNEN
jgi:transcription elongation factor GreA